MDTESGNNDSGINGSTSDEPRNENKSVLPKYGDATHGKFLGKQAGCVRKMSTMLEEEDDVSDDADPDVIGIRRQHQKRPEIESEWSSEEERGRLLNTAKHEILVVPSTSGNNVKRVASHDDSPESIPRDKGHRRRPRLVLDQADSGSSSDRDNGLHSPGRSSSRSIDPRHYRHYCANVRSPRIFSMDENHQHCPCCHQLSPTWTSLYTENNGSQARSFPDTISIRSLASIGLGSSDGRKLTIRRVPTSPSELLNVVHPPPFEDDVSTWTSYDDLDADDPGDYRQPRRLHWANKMEFVLACIGYSVGLGNVWRFPYLCYKSGGGVFLVPYFLILVVCGVPLLYMELSIGQFTRRGPIGALGQVCPLLKGAGLSSVVISFLMSTYHNVIIAYAIYYFFSAFRSEQPWSRCDNSWNSPRCWLPSYGSIDNRTRPNLTRTPSEDFFE